MNDSQKQHQIIKLKATEEQAKNWSNKAQAIGLDRSSYLLNLLSHNERRFPSVKAFSFDKNSSGSC
jgi:hypothetical protein